jgi:hypothetical protein
MAGAKTVAELVVEFLIGHGVDRVFGLRAVTSSRSGIILRSMAYASSTSATRGGRAHGARARALGAGFGARRW